MLKTLTFNSALIALLLTAFLFPVSADYYPGWQNDYPGKILQVFHHESLLPYDSVTVPLKDAEWKQWRYEIMGNWMDNCLSLQQYELMPAETLKYIQSFALPFNGSQFYFNPGLFFKSLSSGDGVAYVSAFGSLIEYNDGTEIFIYHVDGTTGALTLQDTVITGVQSEGGRMKGTIKLEMSPDERFLYMSGPNKIECLAINAETGALTRVNTAVGLPAPAQHLAFSQDGKFVYTSGSNVYGQYTTAPTYVQCHSRDSVTGAIGPVVWQHVVIDSLAPGIVDCPAMILVPGEEKVMVYNCGNGANVQIWDRNKSNGFLTFDTAITADFPISPSCMAFPWGTLRGYFGGTISHSGNRNTVRSFDLDTVRGNVAFNNITLVAPAHWQFHVDTSHAIILGSGWEYPPYDSAFLSVMKVDRPADYPTAVETAKAAPAKADELSVSLNPFNPSTTLSFSLASTAQVRLSVFDASGKMVKMLVNGRQERGRHSVAFNGERLSSGVYACRLSIGNRVSVKRITMIK